MKKHTDESVKTGLQIEAGMPTGQQKKSNAGNAYEDAAKETDADDMVHEQQPQQVNTGTTEQDIDDLVHSGPAKANTDAGEERDTDDLVHETDDYPEE